MEFGSLGLGLQSQSASNQTGVSSLAQTSTLGTNPENAVTPIENGDSAQNDRRQDLLGGQDSAAGTRGESVAKVSEDLQLTSRRTTLNFDSEQNRIFLEIVDTTTDEVIEQIPSDQLVELVQKALDTGNKSGAKDGEAAARTTELAV